MLNILIEFANFFIDNISNFINLIMMLLPDSPFSAIDLGFLAPYLSFINWLIPVGQILTFLSVWCTAIGIYYIYSIALRFTNVVD